MYYILKYPGLALAQLVLAGVVAHGAAIHPILFHPSNVQDMAEVELSPWTLGVTVYGGDTDNVIREHDSLDIAYSTIISTMEDNQSTLSIGVYEGSPFGDILGTIELAGIAPAPMYVPEIEVTFKIHEGWELYASAVDRTSKNSSSIVINMYDRVPEPGFRSFYDGFDEVDWSYSACNEGDDSELENSA